MAGKHLRVGIVGAGSLLGKEVAEEVADSALGAAELVLLDEASHEGQVTTTGGEATLIQRLSADSLTGLDFAFFAGSRATTRAHWQIARATGATTIDLTGALAGEQEVLVWSPWLRASNGTDSGVRSPSLPDLKTAALVAPHAVSLVLALLASRLAAVGALRTMAATVLQPASEQGSAGMDELHQQTVSLLSFHDLPRELYDAQTAFNFLAGFGPESEIKLDVAAQTILEQFATLVGSGPRLDLQLIQAPVFHGYAVSLYLEFEQDTLLAEVTRAISGPHVNVVLPESESPSNLNVAGGTDALVLTRSAHRNDPGRSYWMWIAADNLKFAAANAVESALFMRSLRPQGKVQ